LIFMYFFSFFTYICFVKSLTKYVATNTNLITEFIFQTQNLNDYFSASASVMAGLIAIIFSISLVILEIASNKYSFGVLKTFWKAKITIYILVISISILALSLLFLGLNLQNNIFFILLFCLFILWVICFWKFYQYMIRITNYEGLLGILEKEFEFSLKLNRLLEALNILQDVAETITKATRMREDDLVFKFCTFFQDSCSKFLKIENNNLKTDLMEKYLTILKEFISLKHVQRIFELSFIYSIPANEIIKKENVTERKIDYEFIDNFFKIFLFRLNKEIIDNNDIDAYIQSIDSYSLLNPWFPPLNNKLDTSEMELSEEISKEIVDYNQIRYYCTSMYCLRNLAEKELIYDFNFIHDTPAKVHEIFENIQNDLKKSDKLYLKIEEYKKEFVNCCLKYYIYYNFLKSYIRTGSYVLHKYKKNQSMITKYLSIIWDGTNTKNNYFISSVQLPVTFDLDVLTGLFLYGGKKIGYRRILGEYNSGIFLDSGIYIKRYYVLFVTWILSNKEKEKEISKFNVDWDFCHELYPYYFRFCNDFQFISDDLIEICTVFLKESNNWEELFDDPTVAFEKTIKWIEGNKKFCEEKSHEIISQLELDEKKCEDVKKEIIEKYKQSENNQDINKLMNISYCKKLSENKAFKLFKAEEHVPKNSLLAGKYTSFVVYGSRNISHEIGKKLVKKELDDFLDSVRDCNQIKSFSKSIRSSSEFKDIVVEAINEMKMSGLSPSALILNKSYSQIWVRGYISRKIKITENESIPIIWVRDNSPNVAYLIDKNSGEMIYEKDKDGFLECEFTDKTKEQTDEKNNRVLIRAYTKLYYEITNPDAIMMIKLDFSPELKEE